MSCVKKRECAGECFYCRKPLDGRHEHDHAPIPDRHDGTDTVPACMECHTLKDRLPLEQWGVDLMMRALEECGPLGRIYLAKSMAVIADARAAIDAAESVVAEHRQQNPTHWPFYASP